MTPDSVQAETGAPDRMPEEGHLFYAVRLAIKHPTVDPDRITQALGITPDWSWKVGASRSTPAGRSLPGRHGETYWTSARRVTAHRAFFDTAVDFLDMLERHADFVRGLADSGGTVAIVAHLSGADNIGDDLTPAMLARMAALNIGLGIEVFPDFAP